MVDFAQQQLGLRRLARLVGPISVRGSAGNATASPDGVGLVGEITFIVGVFDDPAAPAMFLESLNLVFDPSDRLGGGQATPSAHLAPGSLPPVAFDARTGAISADLELHVDVPAGRADRERQPPSDDNHAPDPQMQASHVTIAGRFRPPLRPLPNGREVLEVSITIDGPDGFRAAGIFPDIVVIKALITCTWMLVNRPRRQLMVQPVFIAASVTQLSTGSAFAPLMARANELWGKCCLQLVTLSPPLYVPNQARRIVTADDAALLKDEVPVTGAIAVFMVERFDPVDALDGGATWGGGTANAKIVTGDNQLPVNRNHLAHEFGHVLSLCHPTTGCFGPRADGCRGSLMEGSGFFSDNPDFQCEANCHHAANPLLTTVMAQSCPTSGRPDDELF